MSHDEKETEAVETGPAPLHGLLAQYEDPASLKTAAKKVRDAGYRKWDTYTPFPVHGIERAMGIRMTGLPWIVLAAALTGLGTAIWLQWWTNAVDYPFLISGKPFWSIPANVPIYFELTVLFSAFAALGGMLLLNNLPHPSHPLDNKRLFDRSSDDRFYLYVEAADPKFDEEETRELIENTHPAAVEDVHEDRASSDRLPPALVYGLIIITVASLVPFAYFAKNRASTTGTTRIHAIGDMDWQVKFKAQQPNPLFANDMAMRAPEPGTVAMDQLDDDDHFYRGKMNGGFALTFPDQVKIDDATMKRGKERFGIYCAPCHGLAGQGDGMVSQRAMALAEGTWVPPSNLTQEYLRMMPVGQIFNTVTHGIRNMPAYGPQIPPEDRWDIILYVRALQHQNSTPVSELTDAERAQLK
jgi:mono/diheme cytochrome c family protein